MAKQKKKKPIENTVDRILSVYKQNLLAIHTYYDKFVDIAVNEDKDGTKKSIEYLKKCLEEVGINTKHNKDEKDLSITKEKATEFAIKMMDRPKLSSKHFEILSTSSFLLLNNYFEYLLSDLLTYYYNKYRKALNSKDIKMTLKEVDEYETIQELEKAIIFREVETMLIELSFDKLLKHFSEKLNIELNNEIIDWEVIKEFRERRHLLVHNGSLVNKKYLSVTNNPEKLKIGDKIDISKEYFYKAYNEYKIAGWMLSYECWGNWDNTKTDQAILKMLFDSFDELKNGFVDNSYRITQYMAKIEPRNEKQEDYLLRAKINNCIALKKMKKKSQLKAVLKEIKIGTATPIFKLAHSILSDSKPDIIIEYIKQTKTLNEIDFDKYIEWPIYSFIQENKALNKQVEEILKN